MRISQISFLVRSVLQRLARLEFRLFGSLDLDLRSGLWIAPGTRRALADFKRAEAYELHLAAPLQFLGNGIHKRIQYIFVLLLDEIRSRVHITGNTLVDILTNYYLSQLPDKSFVKISCLYGQTSVYLVWKTPSLQFYN